MWHQCYGHLGSNAMSEMARREVVIGLAVFEERPSDETLCTGCALEKFDRKPYRPSGTKANNLV